MCQIDETNEEVWKHYWTKMGQLTVEIIAHEHAIVRTNPDILLLCCECVVGTG